MKMRSLLLVTVLAGCAATGGSMEKREADALQRRLADRVASEPRRCVPAIQAVALDAADRRTIVYDTPGILYVNRLAADCPGLRPDSRIVIEISGDQYCAGDRIRALDPGSRMPGPLCRLGAFTPYRTSH